VRVIVVIPHPILFHHAERMEQMTGEYDPMKDASAELLIGRTVEALVSLVASAEPGSLRVTNLRLARIHADKVKWYLGQLNADQKQLPNPTGETPEPGPPPEAQVQDEPTAETPSAV
jgi:hypothetical protein